MNLQFILLFAFFLFITVTTFIKVELLMNYYDNRFNYHDLNTIKHPHIPTNEINSLSKISKCPPLTSTPTPTLPYLYLLPAILKLPVLHIDGVLFLQHLL